MKKQSILVLFVALSFIAKSQNIDLGLNFSPHFSWYKISNESDDINAETLENGGVGFGFAYGIMGDINFTDNYGLSVMVKHRLMYNKTNHRDTVSGDNIVSNWQVQYVAIPVALKMKTNEIGKIKIYGKFGISPEIRLNASIEENDKTGEINLFNASVLIGGGIHYNLFGTTDLLAGLTFHNGFMRINDKKEAIFTNYNASENLIKSSLITIDLGVLF